MATRYTYDSSTKLSQYDLISTLNQLIKESPLYWKICRIKVHQDNGDTYNNIDEWVRVNIEVGRLTKHCQWRQIHPGATHHSHKAISGAIQPTTM